MVTKLTALEAFAAEARSPFALQMAIAHAQDREELSCAARQVNRTVIGLHQVGLPPAQISAVISAVVDALVRRAIELAIASDGHTFAQFAWLSLGSHGRGEGVPSSDIDSGLVWVEGEGSDPAGYLHIVADQVIETLAAAGWRSDAQGVTASGSVSARSAGDWQRAIRHWLGHPLEEKVLMAISILLDSRTVYGPDNAFDALATLQTGRDRPLLLRLLLRLALAYKPPTRFLRDIVVEHSGEHRGSFDIKRGGLVPIVDIARYAALSAGATVTSTVERLRTAADAGTLSDSEARTLEEAYDLFAGLRLEHQVRQLEAGISPDDHLDPKKLTPLMRSYLHDAFRAVTSVQKGLSTQLSWST